MAPDVPPTDVALIRRSRWLLPLVLEPFVVVLPLAVVDDLSGASAATRSAGMWLVVVGALLSLVPGARSQYRIHRDGFNAGRRTWSKSTRQSFTLAMVAVGSFMPFVPPLLKAAVVGVCVGVLQGAVVGSEVAYVRLLRAARAS